MQVVTSSRKLNFRRDMRCVARRTHKFPRKYTQVTRKLISSQIYDVFYSLTGCINNEWTSLDFVLTWVGLPNSQNLRRLACKFDLDQSERESSQVHTSARKAWANEVIRRTRLSNYVYLRVPWPAPRFKEAALCAALLVNFIWCRCVQKCTRNNVVSNVLYVLG